MNMTNGINFFAQPIFLIALIMAVRSLLGRRISPRVMYALWLIPAMRLLMPFSYVNVPEESLLGRMKVMQTDVIADKSTSFPTEHMAASRTEEAGNGDTDAIEHNYFPDKGIRHDYTDNAADTDKPVFRHKYSFMQSARKAAPWIWLMGSILLAGITWEKNRLFLRRIKKEGRRLDDLKLPDSMAGERLPDIYMADWMASPCLAGIYKPFIVLNRYAAQSEDTCAYVLMHEAAHYRQKDNVWTFIRNLLCIIYWWNPFIWLMNKYCAIDGELSCDAYVIKHMSGEQKKEYGKVLIQLVRNENNSPACLYAATMMTGGKNILKQRIENIAEKGKKSKLLTLSIALLLVLTGIGCGIRVQETEEKKIPTDTESVIEEETVRNAVEAGAAAYKGSDAAELDYTDLDAGYIIFHWNNTLYIYDLVYGEITRQVQLTDSDNQQVQLADCAIAVSEDGRWVYVMPQGQGEMYTYSVNYHTLHPVPRKEIEGLYNKAEIAGELVCSSALKKGDCVYRTNEKEYRLFPQLQEHDEAAAGPETAKTAEEDGAADGRADRITEALRDQKASIIDETVLQDEAETQYYAELRTKAEADAGTMSNLYIAMLNEWNYAGICALSEGVYYDEETQGSWDTVKGSVRGVVTDQRADKLCMRLEINVEAEGESGLEKGMNIRYLYLKYGQDRYGNKRWYADGIIKYHEPSAGWWSGVITSPVPHNNGGIGYSKTALAEKMGEEFINPCEALLQISEDFGRRTSVSGDEIFSETITMNTVEGSGIVASASGTVRMEPFGERGDGLQDIAIEHSDNIWTYYLGCSKVTVRAGDEVKKGQRIGRAGYLDEEFGIRYRMVVENASVNPEKYFSE